MVKSLIAEVNIKDLERRLLSMQDQKKRQEEFNELSYGIRRLFYEQLAQESPLRSLKIPTLDEYKRGMTHCN
jgi:hypothetical protein